MSILVLSSADFALDAALQDRWLAELPPARRDALLRRPDDRARHQSLIGSRLLCLGLRHFGHRGDLLASLRYCADGRPALALPIDFSLSHCTGRVLCAVSNCGPVGVDVEAVGPLLAAGFPSYLDAAERAWAGDDHRRFYSVWTRKEAVVKASGGRGLADLARVHTGAAAEGAAFDGRTWQTVDVPVGEGYLAHLAMAGQAGPAPVVSVVRVSRQMLEDSAAAAS
jgi:4'-phosphopantetheinyl transferase